MFDLTLPVRRRGRLARACATALAGVLALGAASARADDADLEATLAPTITAPGLLAEGVTQGSLVQVPETAGAAIEVQTSGGTTIGLRLTGAGGATGTADGSGGFAFAGAAGAYDVRVEQRGVMLRLAASGSRRVALGIDLAGGSLQRDALGVFVRNAAGVPIGLVSTPTVSNANGTAHARRLVITRDGVAVRLRGGEQAQVLYVPALHERYRTAADDGLVDRLETRDLSPAARVVADQIAAVQHPFAPSPIVQAAACANGNGASFANQTAGGIYGVRTHKGGWCYSGGVITSHYGD